MVTDLLEAMPVYLGTATETMTGKWGVSLIKGEWGVAHSTHLDTYIHHIVMVLSLWEKHSRLL